MEQPNRNYTDGTYRYGFQGQEKDDELKGKGNSVNYKYRMHDPRVGRFFAVDPLAPEYPWNSTYAFSENRVVDGVELEGLEYHYFMFMPVRGRTKPKLVMVGKQETLPHPILGGLFHWNARIPVDLNVVVDPETGLAHIVPEGVSIVPENQYKNWPTLQDAHGTAEALQDITDKVGTLVVSYKASKLKKRHRKMPAWVIEGKKFEKSYFNKLRKEGKKITTQVSFSAIDPKTGKRIRAVVDGIIQNPDGTREFIETKLRKTTKLTKNQVIVYEALKRGNATAVGQKAKEAGFKIGKEYKATVQIKTKY